MKQHITIAAGVFFGVVCAAAAGIAPSIGQAQTLSGANAAAPDKAQMDRPVRDFVLPNAAADTPGARVKLSDFRNKKNVVLVWMSYTCPVTRQYEERLGKLAQAYGGAGSDTAFVAVHANSPETNARIRRYAQDKNFAGPVLDDKAKVPGMTEYFGVRATPTVVIVDKQGVLRFKGRIDNNPSDERGMDPLTKPLVAPALIALRQGKEVTVKTSPTPG